jgi:hypothetical protein
MWAAEAIYSRFALLDGNARDSHWRGCGQTYCAVIKSWPLIRAMVGLQWRENTTHFILAADDIIMVGAC